MRIEDIRKKTRRIVTTAERIESRQLLWYGHLMRMEETRWPKRALRYAPHDRSKRGRRTTQFIDGIRKNMKDRAINED
nr:unnamed protein product [Callosobruchus chinensis]